MAAPSSSMTDCESRPRHCLFPGLLQARLHDMQETQFINPGEPIAFVNCQQYYSLQGPLEVLSRGAAKQFLPNVGTCMEQLPWKDWGEDWFVGKCLDNLGVQKREGFELLDDYWCDHQAVECSTAKPAFHPQKTTADLERCFRRVLPDHVFEEH